MKHTRRTLTLLLAAMMLSTALLPMAGCTSTPGPPDSPFNDTLPPDYDQNGGKNTDKEGGKNTDHTGGNGQTAPDPDTDTIASRLQDAVTGEKRLYGKTSLYEPPILNIHDEFSSVLRYGDMLFCTTSYSNMMGYLPIDEPGNARLLCFDPLCPHMPGQDSCPSNINYYQDHDKPGENGMSWYIHPMGWYIDLYESTDGPVIYLFYRRSEYYTVGYAQEEKRDPVYCIERYEMAQGRRTTVIDGVENTIAQACNYGDSIYYVLDMGEEKGKELHRIDKSGNETAKLELDKKTESTRIVDVVDDQFYYTVDEKYLYRCTLDLTESEMVLDLSTLKGENGSVGVVQGSYSGSLYYFADVEEVTTEFLGSQLTANKADLYRIPMNDLTQAPEKVVEDLNYGYEDYMFAEKTFYYTPCLFNSGDIQPSYSDGKLMALDLTTGESKTIVEGVEMNINLKLAWDDAAVFSGTAYTEKGESLAGKERRNLVMAYASGEPYEIWTTGFGSLSDEYLESVRAASKAALENYK